MEKSEKPIFQQKERNKTLQVEFRPKNQLVQTELNSPSEKPAKNSFLGKQTQIVKKETVKRESRSTPPQSLPSQPSSSSLTQNKMADLSLSKLGLKPKWNEALSGVSELSVTREPASETLLNTQEYVFYSYYQRIRDRLESAWGPLLKVKLQAYYQMGRSLATDHDHTTKLQVVLNRKGEVTRVELLEESGTRHLDEAAVESFNRAGPFPNPPKDLMSGREEISIPWDFVLKT